MGTGTDRFGTGLFQVSYSLVAFACKFGAEFPAHRGGAVRHCTREYVGATPGIGRYQALTLSRRGCSDGAVIAITPSRYGARKRQAKGSLPRRGDMGTPLDAPSAQAAEVIDRLYEEYPDSTISLDYANRLELLVAVVLSAQCTDERVNQTTTALFEKYPTAADYAAADESELAEDIYGITFHNNKAGYLKEAGQIIAEEHDGEVPDTMAGLTDLPGVGRKTANVVLQHGHDVVEGIVVDTHVQRLSRRLGITEEQTPEKIEADLLPVVPEREWQQFTHLLIDHGRATCTARNPDCGDCVLADICPSEKGDSAVDLASGDAW